MTTFPPPKGPRRLLWLSVISLAATTAICAPLVVRSPTFILWNASASVPEGLYIVQPNASLHVGDLAVSRLPTGARRLAADRLYLPPDVLLIKPVAATNGSEVCRRGLAILVDGMHLGNALPSDRLHRLMPAWQGCHVLAPSEIFLMNPAVPDSFDGRYFGPTPLGLAKGRAFPLLTFAQRPRN
jgi:conjugative transfer signal peptidase TraF